MTFFNIIKKSVQCVFENPAITLLFVLFLIGTNFMAPYIVMANSKIMVLLAALCLFGFIFSFLAGWFEVIKKSCNREKIKETNFYPIFLEGIGKNIITSALCVFVYVAFLFLAVLLAQKLAIKYFGSLDFFFNDFNSIVQNNVSLADYYAKLSDKQKDIIYGWNICIICAAAIYNFVMLFYFPVVFNDEKSGIFARPFVGVYHTLEFVFKHFFDVFLIWILIHFTNTLLAALNTKFAANMVLSIVFLLLYIYFLASVVMLIFNYYEEKNNRPDGLNCVGQDENVNKISKED